MKLTTGEVNLGHATVLRHTNGGWVAPGGTRIHSKREATTLAMRMDDVMAEAFLIRKLRSPEPLPPVTLTRRNVSHSADAQRWTVPHA
ncbi:hypothetical protein [Bacteriophage Phobos]|uniref:Uncharacterized protein n=1 Tax=Bacteriophage Phobos TaxID=2662138 RepID=A0A5Q2U9S6_9CAUD|nr:hypothetical protein JT319_gp04 [Bacteriophage Phobos]QGH44973.1 hypothetical protein [Bacteriophage Phobos]